MGLCLNLPSLNVVEVEGMRFSTEMKRRKQIVEAVSLSETLCLIMIWSVQVAISNSGLG